MSMSMSDVVRQLKKERDRLNQQIQGISAALSAFGAVYSKSGSTTGGMSVAGRARISAAQKARWATVNAGKKKTTAALKPASKKRTMSPSARKKIAAAQKLRWAKIKAQN